MADHDERQHSLERGLQEGNQRTEQGCQHADPDQDGSHAVGVTAEDAREGLPVHARDTVQAEVAHDPCEEDADRRRRDGVRVRKPEVERHGARLRQEADDDQRERDYHEPVRAVS